MQNLLATEAQVFQPVAAVVGQAAAMAQQIAEPQLARDEGIVHPEAGVAIDHAVVPADASLADQGRQNGGRNGLGHRSELEDGVGIDAFGPADLAHPVALFENDLIPMDDNNGDTGKVHLSKSGVCQFVELSDGGLHSFGREIFLSRRRTTQNVGQGASDKNAEGDAADNSHAGTSRSDECRTGSGSV